MTNPFDPTALPAPRSAPNSQPAGSSSKKSGGCLKWGAIIAGALIVITALAGACSPDPVETEVPGPTVTVTETTTPPRTTVTETETVTTQAEAAASEPDEATVPQADSESRQRFAAVPEPTPTPTPTPAPAPAPAPASAPSQAYYANCDAVRAAGAAPLLAGSPGYRSGLDRDGDGIACEN